MNTTDDRDVLLRLAGEVVVEIPRREPRPGEPQQSAWVVLIPLIADAVLAIIRSCREDTPSAIRKRSDKVRRRSIWNPFHIPLHREYDRTFREVRRQFDAAGAPDTTDDLIAATDAVFSRAATATDGEILACRRVADGPSMVQLARSEPGRIEAAIRAVEAAAVDRLPLTDRR